uniref:Dol-P-Glc:Glc(2)Man(9)GlcNAc(2)-PP-Dol alpha-1,2-glucosyltransferase n=1 Tax=Crassostrea virginica TaxID=6565 RepID=A0A8B8BER7_CRAVI|nr:putative Dol-P-Glc:Glc(2)Man(9)GlcNAc(2)-PP-Dol alpha-1,2-glucosyltransferase isoform X4 [Crassostrea virginica]
MGHAANVLAFAGIFAVNSVLMYVINQVQQSPYMDEIFHIRQAKHYCHGNFSVWDPMITTLPGLYLVTVGILRPLTLLLGADVVCSVTGFRLINILFQSGTFYVLKAIYGMIHSKPTAEKVGNCQSGLNDSSDLDLLSITALLHLFVLH